MSILISGCHHSKFIGTKVNLIKKNTFFVHKMSKKEVNVINWTRCSLHVRLASFRKVLWLLFVFIHTIDIKETLDISYTVLLWFNSFPFVRSELICVIKRKCIIFRVSVCISVMKKKFVTIVKQRVNESFKIPEMASVVELTDRSI